MTPEHLAKLHEELALYLRKDMSAHNWLERRQIEKRMNVLRQAIKMEEDKRDETKSS